MGEYDEVYVDGAEFAKSVAAVGARFQIEMFQTPEEARVWIRSNTDLVEEEPGKFLIHPAGTGIDGKPIEAKYLTIV